MRSLAIDADPQLNEGDPEHDFQLRITVLSVNGRTGAVSLTNADVGLGNVKNVTQEPALGNPGTSGFVLSSTTGGVRSWVAAGSGTVTNFTAGTLSPLFTTSVANPTAAPALTFALSTAAAHSFLGNNTGGTAAPAYVQPAFTDLSGSLAAAQMPALTGDVTTSAGTVATTIANSAVTLAKMANMATASLIYRKTAGTGVPEVNTLAILKSDLLLTGTNSGDQIVPVNTTATGSNFFTAYDSATGAFTKAQPTFTDLAAHPTTIGTYGITDFNSLGDARWQAVDSDLTTIAGLTATTDNFLVSVASAWASRTPAQVRTTLALVVGTNVQAWDADLDALAALSGTNNIYYRSAANTWSSVTIGSGLTFSGGSLASTAGGGSVTDFSAGDLSPLFTTSEATTTTTPALTFTLSTAAANTFFGNGTGSTAAPAFMSASTARTALGLVIGTNVQAWDADLDTWATVTPTTVGQNIVKLANPSAISFIKIAADNSVSSRTPSQVQTDLSLVPGTNVQAWDTDLDVIAAFSSTGLAARTGAGTWSQRTVTGTSAELTVTNGDGVSGNPTLSIPSAVTFTGKTITGGTYSSPTLTTPALGTPASGTLTNATGLPQAGTVGLTTSDSPQFTAVNIGHATDTTVARVAAGQISVEGVNIMTTSSTDTLTNKTYDAAATGNVLKQKSYIYLSHPHLVDGTNATLGTTATAIDYGHATFSNSVDQATNYAEYYIQVPEDLDTSVALRARIKVRLGGADTGSQRYVLSSVSVADSAVPTASTLANAINIDFAGDGSGASGDVETSAWTTLTSWAGALTAGQTWRIRLARDGDTSDTSTVNSTELGLVIEYGSTQ